MFPLPLFVHPPCSRFVRSTFDQLLSNRVVPRVVAMENHFIKVTDVQAFEEMANRSKERAVVIFKHSLTCPISSAAYEQMAEFTGEVALVEVQHARELSAEIENRLGVDHQSPQVIVLRNGQVIWNASHFKITADAVAKAVSESEDGSKRVAGNASAVPGEA